MDPNFRHVSKKTDIKQCERRLPRRLGSPVEKAVGELLMKPRVPSLENGEALTVC